jgi:hypothetical protein
MAAPDRTTSPSDPGTTVAIQAGVIDHGDDFNEEFQARSVIKILPKAQQDEPRSTHFCNSAVLTPHQD